LGLDVEVRQARAFGREPVDARCRRAAKDTAAVATYLAVAEVVHQDEDDVGLASVCCECAKRADAKQQCHDDASGFHAIHFTFSTAGGVQVPSVTATFGQ
jgi:hypothetical protein